MSNQSLKSQPIQIILTGAIGVGKTTLANHLLSLVQDAVGFRTVPLFEDQTKVGFGFQPLGGEIISFARYNPHTKRYEVDLGVFEDLGCAILRTALQTGKFLFIDEIGFFEQPAKRYRKLLQTVLCSRCDYLVVIQQRVLDFWLEGVPRAEITFSEVAPGNRERILNEFTPRLKTRHHA